MKKIKQSLDIIVLFALSIFCLFMALEPKMEQYGVWEVLWQITTLTFVGVTTFVIVFVTPVYIYLKKQEKKQRLKENRE